MIYHVISRIHSAVVIAFSALIFVTSIYLFSWLGIERQTTEAGFLVLSTIITLITVTVVSGSHVSMRQDVITDMMQEYLLIDRIQIYFVELLLTSASFTVLQLLLLFVYIMQLYNLPVSTILYSIGAFSVIVFGIYHIQSICNSVKQERIDKIMDALKQEGAEEWN